LIPNDCKKYSQQHEQYVEQYSIFWNGM
jgi:hypothetical protein